MGLLDRLGGLFVGDDETGRSDRGGQPSRPAASAGRRRTTGTDGDASSTGAASGSLADEQCRRATHLAETWPDYDLAFSPASLERLDDLIADEYDGSPPDADRDELLADSPPGVVPEGASLALGSGGATADMAAYVGEVFVRAYAAEWRGDEERPQIEIRGNAGTAELDPLPLVAAAIRGHVSFARVHDALADDAGLDATGD